MDIENQAFRQLWILLSVGTVSLVFCSILSCIMFKWINGSLHPYIQILEDQIKEENMVKSVKKVVLVSISHLNTEQNQTWFITSLKAPLGHDFLKLKIITFRHVRNEAMPPQANYFMCVCERLTT